MRTLILAVCFLFFFTTLAAAQYNPYGPRQTWQVWDSKGNYGYYQQDNRGNIQGWDSQGNYTNWQRTPQGGYNVWDSQGNYMMIQPQRPMYRPYGR